MKLNDMKKLIIQDYTPAKLKKEVSNKVKYLDNAILDIRVYTVECDSFFTANLMIDIWDGEEYRDITPFSIEIDTEEINIDFWEFKELAEKALASRKAKLIEEYSKCYRIGNTEDYNC